MIVADPRFWALGDNQSGSLLFFYVKIQGLSRIGPVCADDRQLVSVQDDLRAIFPGLTVRRPGIHVEKRAFRLKLYVPRQRCAFLVEQHPPIPPTLINAAHTQRRRRRFDTDIRGNQPVDKAQQR